MLATKALKPASQGSSQHRSPTSSRQEHKASVVTFVPSQLGKDVFLLFDFREFADSIREETANNYAEDNVVLFMITERAS
jgi:hypothetical protein